MLVLDPWEWINEDGSFIVDDLRVYRRALRIARIIEYGGPLEPNEARGTLLECKKQPKGKKPCVGLIWVSKTDNLGILAHCHACGWSEGFVRNWQDTQWAEGMTEARRVLAEPEPVRH